MEDFVLPCIVMQQFSELDFSSSFTRMNQPQLIQRLHLKMAGEG
jgi:hypothetical protein